jgi:hypothetical protein
MARTVSKGGLPYQLLIPSGVDGEGNLYFVRTGNACNATVYKMYIMMLTCQASLLHQMLHSSKLPETIAHTYTPLAKVNRR